MHRFILIVLIFLSTPFETWAKNDYEQDLQDIANSIKMMERRDDEISQILGKLESDRDSLFQTLYQRRLEATKNLHVYYSLANKPAILSYLNHGRTLHERYFQKLYQDNINTILSRSIDTDVHYFTTLEDKINAIHQFEREKTILSQTLQSGLDYLAEKSPPSSDAELDIVIKDLRDKSKSLNDFIQNLLNLDGKPSFQPSNGPIHFALPANGIIEQSIHGLFIKTSDNALVTAPADGRIMFAGEYKPLGLIVIIDHGQGYFSVLRGFSQILARNGLLIDQGDPLGIVSAQSGVKKQGQNTNGPMLYYELWYNKKQINPIERLSGT